ncbi:MAG: cell division ATP-binding protein FtsE [Deltaproteobacteria bacterium]|nr:cell division ATP-binding protein FtsE [Deltaproteobacteria bacterium]MCB9785602.1 cell division ATP-binding protein FtsE [Deltaproteobacteria bacterium]
MPGGHASFGVVIQLYHVTKRYSNGIEALRDVTLRIHEGEFVFLSGPSGAGKTTLTKLLMVMEQASEGQVLVAGRNLAVLKRSSIPYLRRNIGVVWQDFKLLPQRNVFDNVAIALEILALPRKQIARRVDQVLEMVGLERYARSMPHWLSGGEQQRVAIARALVNDPAILLADEPTGNLDPDLSVDIMRMLIDVQQRGTTVMVATHDRSLMDRFGKRVVLLNKGFLIEDGAPVDVLPGSPGQLPDLEGVEPTGPALEGGPP